MKGILALLDSDRAYTEAFARHAARDKAIPFEIHAFTNAEEFQRDAADQPGKVVLISEKDLRNLSELSNLSRMKGCRILLTEDRGREELKETTDPAGISFSGMIYQYQPISLLMRKVLLILSQTGGQVPTAGSPTKAGMRKIGVFSPVNRCGKSTLCREMAEVLAKTGPTLLIALDPLNQAEQGSDTVLKNGKERTMGSNEQNPNQSLEEYLFYVRQGAENPAERLLAMVRQENGIGRLPTFAHSGEIFSVREEEWTQLFSCISDQTGYEAVVADLGIVPIFCPPILLNFTEIYMPYLKENEAERKTRAFENLLNRDHLERELQERIYKFEAGMSAEEVLKLGT